MGRRNLMSKSKVSYFPLFLAVCISVSIFSFFVIEAGKSDKKMMTCQGHSKMIE